MLFSICTTKKLLKYKHTAQVNSVTRLMDYSLFCLFVRKLILLFGEHLARRCSWQPETHVQSEWHEKKSEKFYNEIIRAFVAFRPFSFKSKLVTPNFKKTSRDVKTWCNTSSTKATKRCSFLSSFRQIYAQQTWKFLPHASHTIRNIANFQLIGNKLFENNL